MFSNFIQNLLNTGGQTQAIQRYSQIASKIDTPQQNIDILYPKQVNKPSFEKILQAQAQSNFGTLLLNPHLKEVNSEIVEQNPQISLNSTLSETLNVNKPSKAQILNVISQISKKHGVDEKLVQALIKQESGFNPNAKSKAGAIGLMQLMPSTARGLGVNDPYNMVQNVEGGVKYLKSMLNKYNGNVILALAAYNAGPNAVDRYDGVPPYSETQNYVKNILANYL